MYGSTATAAPLDTLAELIRNVGAVQKNPTLYRWAGVKARFQTPSAPHPIPAIPVIREIEQYRTAGCLTEIERIIENQKATERRQCFWLYFDIKEGFIGEKVLNKCKDESAMDWLSECLCIEKDKISEINIAGLGDGLIQKYFSSGPAQKAMHCFVRTEYWSRHFSDWFDEIMWLTAGDNPSIAN